MIQISCSAEPDQRQLALGVKQRSVAARGSFCWQTIAAAHVMQDYSLPVSCPIINVRFLSRRSYLQVVRLPCEESLRTKKDLTARECKHKDSRLTDIRALQLARQVTRLVGH